jgi:two-component system sensor histidine kinase/response regulator
MARAAVLGEPLESEIRFRSVAESASDAIISADSLGLIISWNRAAERLFGYSESAAIGQSLSLIVPLRHRQAHDSALTRLSQGGPARVIGRVVELEGLRCDGSEFPLELSLATWEAGGQRFYSGILRDISQRRLAEEKLRQVAARLRESEREAHAAKEDALRLELEAREASAAKTRFLAHMSHELRTPLNVILGFSQLLGRDQTLKTEQREHVAVVLRAGEHLLGLINGILSLAKIESGQGTLEQAPFDLPRLFAGIEALFRRRAQDKGLTLRVELDAHLPRYVRGDEGKLRQVLINLLGNAIKFTAQGETALRARWQDGVAFFAVSDTGPGLSPEEQRRLFRPFVQLDLGQQRGYEGTGLGLSISQSFVRLMGGELRVHSEVGQGASFDFAVPLGRSAEEIPAEPAPVCGLAPGQPVPRILVAEDDPDSRQLLVRLLGDVGIEVQAVGDGQAAVAQWQSFQPHLIFMDLRMPGVDGRSAIRQIRAAEVVRGAAARVLIVALTASAFDHERDALLAGGCDAFVTKPYSAARLFSEIESLLALRFQRALAPAIADDDALSGEELARLPADTLSALRAALNLGDAAAARDLVEHLMASAPQTALKLRDRVVSLQFDELLGLLERAGFSGDSQGGM